MKRSFFLCLAGIVILQIQCRKDTKISPKNSSRILTDGTWRITYFNDNGQIETHHFVSYGFTFNDNNIVIASGSSGSISGIWNIRKDDGITKLNLDFGNVAHFEELNDDWDIISQNSGKIELKDVSDKNKETDYLIFEKK